MRLIFGLCANTQGDAYRRGYSKKEYNNKSNFAVLNLKKQFYNILK